MARVVIQIHVFPLIQLFSQFLDHRAFGILAEDPFRVETGVVQMFHQHLQDIMNEYSDTLHTYNTRTHAYTQTASIVI